MEVIWLAVRVADKLQQFNNGTYMLMDASAVEFKNSDGTTCSVQQALELGGGGTVDLSGYKKTYTSESELFIDSRASSIYDIIVKLKEGEVFLDYTRYYNIINTTSSTINK